MIPISKLSIIRHWNTDDSNKKILIFILLYRWFQTWNINDYSIKFNDYNNNLLTIPTLEHRWLSIELSIVSKLKYRWFQHWKTDDLNINASMLSTSIYRWLQHQYIDTSTIQILISLTSKYIDNHQRITNFIIDILLNSITNLKSKYR